MKNIIKIFILLFLFLINTKDVSAQKIAGQSAKILKVEVYDFRSERLAKKKIAIKNLLKRYDSPLVESVNAFLNTCVSYNLDCYLLPSIAGLESSFGRHVLTGSYNPFGWGNGLITFKNWDQAINSVGRGLKTNYIDQGADSVEKIAPIYAASNTWAPRIENFINNFSQEENKIDLIIGQNTVKL